MQLDKGGKGLTGPVVCVVWCTPVVRRMVLQCKHEALPFKSSGVATRVPPPKNSELGVREMYSHCGVVLAACWGRLNVLAADEDAEDD